MIIHRAWAAADASRLLLIVVVKVIFAAVTVAAHTAVTRRTVGQLSGDVVGVIELFFPVIEVCWVGVACSTCLAVSACELGSFDMFDSFGNFRTCGIFINVPLSLFIAHPSSAVSRCEA